MDIKPNLCEETAVGIILKKNVGKMKLIIPKNKTIFSKNKIDDIVAAFIFSEKFKFDTANTINQNLIERNPLFNAKFILKLLLISNEITPIIKNKSTNINILKEKVLILFLRKIKIIEETKSKEIIISSI